jgi:hypothetical protein
MTQLHVSLDFACCDCHEAIGVTVRCTGKGLGGGPRGAARVNVPCPSCGEIIQVIFETCGLVRSVRPYVCQRAPAPSAN